MTLCVRGGVSACVRGLGSQSSQGRVAVSLTVLAILLGAGPVQGEAGQTIEQQFDVVLPAATMARAARAGTATEAGAVRMVSATGPSQRAGGQARLADQDAGPSSPPSPPRPLYGPPAPDLPGDMPANGRSWGPRELIALAGAGHPDVMAAKAKVRAADGGVAAARAEYLPAPQGSLDLSSGLSSASIGVGVPIYSGGRLDALLAQARAMRQAADAGVDRAREQLALSVVDSYAQWAVAVRSERVKQRELERLNERLGLIRRRIAAGASALSDEELVASRIRQAHGELAGYRANAVGALAVLSQLTGTSLSDDMLDQASPLPFLPDCGLLVSQGVTGAPAVVQAERQVDASRASVRATRAGLFPTLSAKLAYTRTRYAPPNSAADRNDFRGYLSVSVAPGAGLGTFARTRSAQADVDAAIETLGSVRRTLTARIEGQCASRAAAMALQGELVGARDSTERVYQSYTRLFVAGKRSWLDVINAAREASSVDLALVQSEERVRAITWTLLLLSGDASALAEPER